MKKQTFLKIGMNTDNYNSVLIIKYRDKSKLYMRQHYEDKYF